MADGPARLGSLSVGRCRRRAPRGGGGGHGASSVPTSASAASPRAVGLRGAGIFIAALTALRPESRRGARGLGGGGAEPWVPRARSAHCHEPSRAGSPVRPSGPGAAAPSLVPTAAAGARPRALVAQAPGRERGQRSPCRFSRTVPLGADSAATQAASESVSPTGPSSGSKAHPGGRHYPQGLK